MGCRSTIPGCLVLSMDSRATSLAGGSMHPWPTRPWARGRWVVDRAVPDAPMDSPGTGARFACGPTSLTLEGLPGTQPAHSRLETRDVVDRASVPGAFPQALGQTPAMPVAKATWQRAFAQPTTPTTTRHRWGCQGSSPAAGLEIVRASARVKPGQVRAAKLTES